MNNILVRKAGESDLDTLADMLGRLFSIEDDFQADPVKQKAGLELIISGYVCGVILIAEADSVIAGMVNLQKVVSTASGGYSVLLEDLYVKPEMRRTGIGSFLLKNAVEWGRKEKALRIQLGADVRNKSALNFYKSIGFARSSLSLHYKNI